MLNKEIERIYCINLDRRVDRWNDASKLFSSFGLNVERVAGIEDAVPWNGLRNTVIGIFKRSINDGSKTILILEDDVDWNDDFFDRFQDAWNSLPDDWDMFYFSAAHQYWPEQHNDHLFKLKWSTAAHAIVFNSKCFDAITSELEGNEEPIDVTYSRLQQRLNAYCCIEPIAWQRRSYSDIEGEEKWYPYLKDNDFYMKYASGKITIDGKEVQSPSGESQ